MKTKLLKVMLVVLVIIGICVSISTFDLDAKWVKGHKLYDANGNVNGCQSPGKDCEFWLPELL